MFLVASGKHFHISLTKYLLGCAAFFLWSFQCPFQMCALLEEQFRKSSLQVQTKPTRNKAIDVNIINFKGDERLKTSLDKTSYCYTSGTKTSVYILTSIVMRMMIIHSNLKLCFSLRWLLIRSVNCVQCSSFSFTT